MSGDAPHVPPVVVHYQPIVELASGRVVGAEALVRFRRADGSLASPTEGGLIGTIESNAGSIEVLMRGLLSEITREYVPLFEKHRGLYVSVNVPPIVMGTGVVGRIIAELGIAPALANFVIEVTERQALSPEGREALAQARALGARVAIDDFGTGQSGLQQIMGLEFDVLKIDRSQVAPLMRDATADRLLRGIVALAGALRVHLTAEGVETREQAMFLHAAGVDNGQGWYWSKALDAVAFERVLRTGFASKNPWATGSAQEASA